MRKSKIFSVIGLAGVVSLVMGMSCIILYSNIEPKVNATGLLEEPFYLLPLGWFSLFAGFVAMCVYGVSIIIRCRRGR